MRERFDFVSISTLIMDNRKKGGFTQTEYFYELFEYALNQEGIEINEPSESDIAKFIKGKRSVPENITAFYSPSEASKANESLRSGVDFLLRQVFDVSGLVESMYNLLMDDLSISEGKKAEIMKNKAIPVQFVSDCILESLSRSFVQRVNGKVDTSQKAQFHLPDYLVDHHYPSVNKVFLGREKEIEKIHELLQGEECVLVQGIGGIGKTELAKQYGKQFKKSYSHVIFLRYSDSLRETIVELSFVDDKPDMSEEERFSNHYRFFKQLGKDTLVILDNFDCTPEEDELFNEFTSLSFRVLVTTRHKIFGMCYYSIKEIASPEALMEIFHSYAPRSKNETEVVQEIIKEVYQHTLMVEMLAKTMTATGLTAEQLMQTLKRDKLLLEDPNKIRVTKDDRMTKDRVLHHLKSLFQTQALNDDEKMALFLTLATPEKGVNKNYFSNNICQLGDCNSINALIEYGWVQEDMETSYISLHPLIREMIARLDDLPLTIFSTVIGGAFDDMEKNGLKLDQMEERKSAMNEFFQLLEKPPNLDKLPNIEIPEETEALTEQEGMDIVKEMASLVSRKQMKNALKELSKVPFHEMEGSTVREDNFFTLHVKQMEDNLFSTVDELEKDGFQFADDDAVYDDKALGEFIQKHFLEQEEDAK